MGIISDTLNTIDGTIGTIAQQGFEAAAGSVGIVISAGSGFLLAVMGLNVLAQIRPMTMGSFVAFAVKLTLIGIFALSWGNFAVVFAILTDVPQSIGNALLGLTDAGSSDGLYASLDMMLARFTEYGDAIGDNAGWVFGAMLGVVFYLIAAAFAAVAAGIIAYASIMLTAMVVVAPYAIACSMFEATKSVFDAWSRSTIGYAAIPIVTGVALGIIAAAGELMMRTAADPESVEEISSILSFVTILFLSIGIMAAIPSVAQNITGSFGLASNAAGLTGLAREGMVKAGEMGAGAAVRLGTGRTPRQLSYAASQEIARKGGANLVRHSIADVQKTQTAFREAKARFAAQAAGGTPTPTAAAGRAAGAALGAAGGPIGVVAGTAAAAAAKDGRTS